MLNGDEAMQRYWEDELAMLLKQQNEARLAAEAAAAAAAAKSSGFGGMCRAAAKSAGRIAVGVGASLVDIAGALSGLLLMPGEYPTNGGKT